MSFNRRSSFSDQISSVEFAMNRLFTDVIHEEKARKKLLAVCQGMVAALESPAEFIGNMIMQPAKSASLKTAIDVGLIESLNKSNHHITARVLATNTGCDEPLVARIMRALAATHVVKETGYHTYAATTISKSLEDPALKSAFTYMFDTSDASLTKMPEFLAITKYKNPEDGRKGIFQHAHNTQSHVFEWTRQDPKRLNAFYNFMGGRRQLQPVWFESFPTDDILFHGPEVDKDAALIVDIAGGGGYDLEAFRLRFPHARGHLILQEMPVVIDGLTNLHKDIMPMKHDFFTPQPIKGARAYYFRTVFHDWSDNEAREILRNIVPAMTEHSKILINEWILPDVNTPVFPALQDIQMMAMFSGLERTETQWKELLKSVGLKVMKFHKVNEESEGLIEAIKAG